MPSAAYEESQSARLYNDASLPFHCNGTNRLVRFEEKNPPITGSSTTGRVT